MLYNNKNIKWYSIVSGCYPDIVEFNIPTLSELNLKEIYIECMTEENKLESDRLILKNITKDFITFICEKSKDVYIFELMQ